MAIPFYEDEPAVPAATVTMSVSTADGDQVDGPVNSSAASSYDEVDYEGPSTGATSSGAAAAPTASAAAASSAAAAAASAPPPSTEEQLLAWKILAIAMCKVLKQLYQQQKQQQQQHPSSGSGSGSSASASTKLTAVVQIQPGQLSQPTEQQQPQPRQ